MRNRMKPPAALLAIGLAATACTGEGGGGGGAGAYPRNETLYTTGTQWGPPANWNPIMNWTYATGTVGYAYETLFLYDPYADEYTPWLAESGDWTGEDTYELKLREGVEWTDGEPLTADDVVFTVELGQMDSVPYSSLWDWLDGAEAVDDHTVRFTFSDPRRQEWANWIYSNAIVPEHLWADRSEEEVSSGANEDPIGTGPYVYETHDEDRMVWAKNEDWWATEALGHEVRPDHIVDIVNSSNDVALGLLTQNDIDISNNFLPGVDQTIDGDPQISSYHPEPPYMLSANTAWLVMNMERAPMDDPEFRRALAHSIDMQRIVEGPYSNLVEPADPTGLLPAWEDFVDRSVVDEHGFSHDPDEARRLLEEAGYTDENGDGLVETPDGDPVDLTIIVPSGWTDWMEAIRIISESAQEVGIDLDAEFPDEAALQDARETGEFDMLINNERQLSNTPWTYYEYLFQLPVQERQTRTNFGRYENEEAWGLVQDLARTPVEDREGMQEIISELQEIHLTEMPVIPLWYNGLWSQVNNGTWTNWPSAAEDTPDHLPTTWRNYNQLGAILTLTEIEPAQ
ncbi:peptide/nickel transport system substrate-binding protein [Spinactinospora alkalitolerans]|uniref:Peptide/nickel transport system substrate-binding protein n=1 Tax=Spinactinospora alkalitolerans TaxID=687207 RepID=A0A852TR64_9ACTN|nr:ABC transporter substrate-binding protein [Spinactinospora alkalitolerans]NYE46051.1 peptide/nickel transport system substrate-binding protein [Spinactinospora alkalitolerans]